MAVAVRSRALDLYTATDWIVGQERARRLMAVLLERQWGVAAGRYSSSPGAIIGGRSGVGKTALTRAMCQHSGLPFAEVNATRYTEAGYAGLDLQHMFLPLLTQTAALIDEERSERPEVLKRIERSAQSEAVFRLNSENALTLDRGANAEKDTEVLSRPDIEEVMARAASGVVFLDEFDKWMLRVNHVTGQKDNAIQADLLKMIEGSLEFVSPNQDEVGIHFDTTKVLIICGGAFVRLQAQVARRLDREADDEAIWDQITPEDLVAYGVLPELAGRLVTHIWLKPLRGEHLQTLLVAPGGLIEEYRQRFAEYDCEWAVTDEGVRHIAEQALRRDTGARAVDHVCWQVFGEALFTAAVSERPTRVRYHTMQATATVEVM